MAFANIQIRTKEFTPASATVDETTALFNVAKGERVLWASAMVMTVATAGQVGTITLGDGDDPDGYIVAFTPTAASQAAGAPLGGAGALLNPSGGKLYTADDTVDVVWDYTSGGTAKPVIRFVIAVVREFPN